MSKSEFESIIKTRIGRDIDSLSDVEYIDDNSRCYATVRSTNWGILICNEPKDHTTMHEDILGGIWWPNISQGKESL